MVGNVILRYLTRKIVRVIHPDSILKQLPNGSFVHMGKVLTKEELHQIVEEAKSIRRSVVLRMILDEVQDILQKEIYDKAESTQEILKLRAGLFTIETIRNKIKSLSNVH